MINELSNLGNVLQSCLVSMEGGQAFADSSGALTGGGDTLVRREFAIKAEEGFAGAFRTAEEEATSGDVIGESVTNGTRFLARFYVPENVRLFVRVTNVETGGSRGRSGWPLKAVLVSGAGVDGSGGTIAAEGEVRNEGSEEVAVSELDVKDGWSFAVWEWVNKYAMAMFTGADSVEFGVVLEFKEGSVGRGCMFADMKLAPLSELGVASATSVPVPRFVDVGGDSETVFTWVGSL